MTTTWSLIVLAVSAFCAIDLSCYFWLKHNASSRRLPQRASRDLLHGQSIRWRASLRLFFTGAHRHEAPRSIELGAKPMRL